MVNTAKIFAPFASGCSSVVLVGNRHQRGHFPESAMMISTAAVVRAG